MNKARLHRELLAWYDAEKRDLPWRRSKDPYRIWISEIMLQQTRVEAVIPYFERFLSNFPTIRDLAAAEEERLLNLWAGLGYYSRAKNLKNAASDIMERFSGHMPEALEDLRSLKGVGPYTAAAIASIAFGRAHAAVDGNLERVLSRLLASRLNPKTEGRMILAELGSELVSLGRPGDVNQAFMDLSASVCVPKEPRCEKCPLAKHCLARRKCIQKKIPVKRAKAVPIELDAEAWLLVSGDAILLAKRPEGEWLSGMWDLPWWIKKSKTAAIGEQFALSRQKRTITKHKITFEVRGLRTEARPSERELKKLPAPAAAYRWVKIADLHGINLPRPSERAISEILSPCFGCFPDSPGNGR